MHAIALHSFMVHALQLMLKKIKCEKDDPTRTRTHLKGGGILTHIRLHKMWHVLHCSKMCKDKHQIWKNIT